MEFSYDFAERMLDAAQLLSSTSDGKADNARAVVYVDFVSIEVSMKALLEQSGMPIPKIIKHSHRILDLLNSVDGLHMAGAVLQPQMKLWPQLVESKMVNGSVGLLLTEACKNGSIYPNEIRYGYQVTSIEPYLVHKTAITVHSWCKAVGGRLVYV